MIKYFIIILMFVCNFCYASNDAVSEKPKSVNDAPLTLFVDGKLKMYYVSPHSCLALPKEVLTVAAALETKDKFTESKKNVLAARIIDCILERHELYGYDKEGYKEAIKHLSDIHEYMGSRIEALKIP